MDLPKTISTFFANIGIGEEKDYFIENLSTLLSSGMNMTITLESIKEEVRSKRMKEIIEELEGEIDAGSPVWKALAKINFMPAQIISLVRIGEETGKLPENLKVIVNQQRKERVFNSRIRSAMMYPILVLSLTLTIGIGISWFILPRLAQVFSQLDIELPFITRVLLAFGAFLGEYGSIAVPIFLLVLSLAIYFTFIFPKTNALGQNLLFLFPGFKKLIQEVELSRMGYLLGTLLDAGIPIIEALDSLSRATTFRRYGEFYDFVRQKIEEGNSFQKSFGLYPKVKRIIPTTIQQMIVSGELSGSLPQSLIKIGEIFEEKTEITMKDLTVILEPILLIIVWMGVVAVSLAIILPIYSLIGGLNKATSPPPPAVEEGVGR